MDELCALFSKLTLENKRHRNGQNVNPSLSPVELTRKRLKSNPEVWDYDVFLSFRGQDTRTGFTDHLYTALIDAGFRAFRDNERLRVGEEIGSELLKGIEQSKISIPIFSSNYANSKWCLIELTQMMKCKKIMDQITVFPIYYEVIPSDVRHQTGRFGEAFRELERKSDKKLVNEWKNALEEVTKLKGLVKDNIADGHESKLIKEVVKDVSIVLRKNNVDVTEDLVGMNDHIEDMTRLLDVSSCNVRIIGIHGMGGIGKTTIAKVIYNQLSDHFQQRCSFLEDVRETTKQGLVHLQNKLIFDVLKEPHNVRTIDEGKKWIKKKFQDQKVLIVLDDVGARSQLLALAEKRDWFGLGSRIIVTTRNKAVLAGDEVYGIYEPKEMSSQHSLRLFSRHAFESYYPPDGFDNLSRNIISIGGGLPLFLEIIGSFLFCKSRAVWEDTCEKLTTIPDGDIQEKLIISYNALDYAQKQIFLDIACHFIGMNKQYCFYMWKGCGFFPENGIDVLLQMSLVKIGDDNVIRMHDQLRDMGRNIVRNENCTDPGSRSRLWSQDDAVDTLYGCTGTEKTVTLSLFWSPRKPFPREAFKSVPNLRYLRLDDAKVDGDITELFLQLRWLRWRYFCFSETKFTNFYPKKLVILDLSSSDISDEWEAQSQIKMATNLKVLDLSNCHNLTKTPNFSALLHLERLNLENCIRLAEISPSVVHLNNLTYFNIRQCRYIKKLPQHFGSMEALREVLLDDTSIEELPVSLKTLVKLSASGCRNVKQVPPIDHLQSLSYLSLKNTGISELPDSIGLLLELQNLELEGCRSLTKLPDSIGNLMKLKKISVGHSGIRNLPDTFGLLKNLEEIIPSNFSFLEGEVPRAIWSLSSLRRLTLDDTNISKLPTSFCGFTSLMSLDLICKNVQLPPDLKLPSSLTELKINYTKSSSDCVVSLLNLKILEFHGYAYTELEGSPKDLSNLAKLEELTFNRIQISSLPVKIYSLSQLTKLSVFGCMALQFIPDLPSSLRSLLLQKCYNLKRLSDVSNLRNLSVLGLFDCREVTEIQGLGRLRSLTSFKITRNRKLRKLDGFEHLRLLRKLKIIGCDSLAAVPDLSNVKKLRKLIIQNNKKLLEIHGLGTCPSLEILNMTGSVSLESLPSLSDCKMLKELTLVKCEKLIEIKGLEALAELRKLDLSFCTSLEKLPDISNLRALSRLCIHDCKKLKEIRGLESFVILEHFQNISGYVFGYGRRSQKDLHYIHSDNDVEMRLMYAFLNPEEDSTSVDWLKEEPCEEITFL